jgi:hypothetical protein
MFVAHSISAAASGVVADLAGWCVECPAPGVRARLLAVHVALMLVRSCLLRVADPGAIPVTSGAVFASP